MNNTIDDYTPDKNDSVNFSVKQLYAILDNVPTCINVLNEKADSVYCNDYTVKLYNIKSKEAYIENFYNLVPENQPDGRNSKLAFSEHVLTALEKGETHFSWLDLNSDNEELPLFISIYKLNEKNEKGEELLVSTMHDLRSQIAGYESTSDLDEEYYHRVTYKDLFNTVAELTDEWFWIYDVNMSTIQFFGKGREILGLSPDKQAFPSYVVDSGMVYPDDLNTFLHFNDNLKNGIVENIEVRFVSPSKKHKYYKIIYKIIYSKDGKPLFSIGKTYDIDKEKKLEILSKTDLLTKCLNKITTENIVRDIIDNDPNSSHALFLIDVDDFKSVNDDLGHYFGDIALRDIASNLHNNFRDGDIIGRIGGDEFLVFVKNISSEKVINRKAQAIADAFSKSYSGENNDYKISGSIGVALFPSHSTSYEELYKCADKALYHSKAGGKDRYTIYSNDLADNITKNLTALENENNIISTLFDSNITSVVFDILYQSENVAKSMNTAVRFIGTQLGVDRCYITQTFDDGKSYELTYEWVSKGVSSRANKFKDMSIDSLKIYFAELEANDIMYNGSPESNGERLDDQVAYLLTQTKGKGFSRLIFGIEDRNFNRVWSDKEIATMQYLIKLISLFLSSSNL